LRLDGGSPFSLSRSRARLSSTSQIASFRQLDHRLITGEVAAVLGDLAQLVARSLDAVGRVYDAPEHRPGRSKPNLLKRSRVDSSRGESCRLAGATTTPTGIPWPSVITERLVPCLPRSTGEGPAAWPPQGALTMQPSTHRSPLAQADDLVVGLQSSLPAGGEHPGGDPLTRVCVGWWPPSTWSRRPSHRPLPAPGPG